MLLGIEDISIGAVRGTDNWNGQLQRGKEEPMNPSKSSRHRRLGRAWWIELHRMEDIELLPHAQGFNAEDFQRGRHAHPDLMPPGEGDSSAFEPFFRQP